MLFHSTARPSRNTTPITWVVIFTLLTHTLAPAFLPPAGPQPVTPVKTGAAADADL